MAEKRDSLCSASEQVGINQEATMKSGLRILTTMLVAFLLLPALLAQDSAKPAATAKAAVTSAPATSPEIIPTHAVPAAPSSGPFVVSNVTLDKRESGETFV